MAQRVTLALPNPAAPGQDINVGSVSGSGVVTGFPISEPGRAKTTSAVTAASTTSQQLYPANTSRARLIIQNQDAAINVFVNFGAAATAGAGSLRIAPGGTLDISGTNQAVNVIAASGTPAITAWEFT